MRILLSAMAGGVAIGLAGAAAATTTTIQFNPGTYYFAESYGGTPDHTLTISVTDGVAAFTLTGDQTPETFSLPDIATPLAGGDQSPTFDSASASANWDASVYPDLSFYAAPVQEGGIQAWDAGSGNTLFNLYQSDVGPGQVYSVIGAPEPAAWALMLVGFGGLGAVLRGRRRALALGA